MAGPQGTWALRRPPTGDRYSLGKKRIRIQSPFGSAEPAIAMEIVDTDHAKAHLSELLERVSRGEVIVIGRAGHAVAQLTAFDPARADRVGGEWKVLFEIGDDFDDPLPGDIADAFGAS